MTVLKSIPPGSVTYCAVCGSTCPGVKDAAVLCAACAQESRRHPLVTPQKETVSFFESVRPLMEQAYDAAGFSVSEAASLDNTLWRMCMRYGPGEYTVEHFISHIEEHGRSTIIESLDEILDDSLDDVLEIVESKLSLPWEAETDVPETPEWGISPRPRDLPYDEKVLPPLTPFRGTTPLSLMLCDLCNRASGALVAITKHDLPGVREVCGECVPVVNRESDNWQPYGQREHMRYT